MAFSVSHNPLWLLLPVVLVPALLFAGCSGPGAPRTPPSDPIATLLEHAEPPAVGGTLARMGYATQVGAFTNLDNAVRLEERLQSRGIDAYYFRHESGLYKVRFGNHPDYAGARAEAEALHAQGLIGEFFIVIPKDYAIARLATDGPDRLGSELVATARRFLGVPYRWGGTDRRTGFDCSGLTMVCYRLNGLDLPRVSRNQFRAGRPIPKDRLRPGDLVFFATRGGGRVSHVGLYIGSDRFIHAPRSGQTVRVARLSSPYFTRTFVGGRRYF